MPFVNEYVSEANVKKYGLEDVLCSANPSFRKRGFPSGFKFHWTFDKERNIYLILLKIGKEDFSNRFKWLLNIDGKSFIFEADKSSLSSMNVNEKPYIVIWNLVVNDKVNSIDLMSKGEFYILKEAIECFGCFGIVNELEEVIVKFNS
ncbi:hypothetical protein SAMN03080615_01950 [Amphritea atlantica]|uniref:Uncharacterized protein n=1 Tax=Amphritea atlantica TaxID=355243 RepID=A0A1H9H5L3_9GAMM|nr:hypothetical protein [Amphritea atlantica]SEQ57527.1 hypothetical protein SAMN03080615_01950 [Amphritea atlantica]